MLTHQAVDDKLNRTNAKKIQNPSLFIRPGLRLSKNRFGGNVKIGAGGTKKRGKSEKFYSIFFKKSREWRGQSPFPGAQLPYFRS